jgi:hypothetical protein
MPIIRTKRYFPLLVAVLCFYSPPPVSAAYALKPFSTDAGLFDPSQRPITIGYQLLMDSERIEVRVIDFRGQVANRFVFVDLRAGDHTFSWDGTDNNGERVADGRYQFDIAAEFTDGTRDLANVDVAVATIEDRPWRQIPEPLPPETHPHRIYGSLSSFYRNAAESEDRGEGELRFRTAVDYRDETRTMRGAFQAIKPFDGSSASYNGTQFLAEQQWAGINLKGVFRDTLGSFDDPFQLFSDFKTGREKLGFSAGSTFNRFEATALAFTSEGNVGNEEQGLAARLHYVSPADWAIGSSFTCRQAREETSSYDAYRFQHTGDPLVSEDKTESQAFALDASYSVTDTFSILAEGVATDDELAGEGFGFGLKAEYDIGPLRLSAGYTSLGEDFRAAFADPLHHVDRDAQGFDAAIEYFMYEPLWLFTSFSATLRYFNLTRPSDDSTLEEADGSMRFGIGEQDTVFLSLFRRSDEFGSHASYMGNLTHAYNDTWSNTLQAQYSETDSSDSLRLTLGTDYRTESYRGRLSLEWSRRTIDYSRFSPYDQAYLRFDFGNDLYLLQVQASYTSNKEESGLNLFTRFDYTPEFLHRYHLILYASLGNRAAIETQEQYEIGIEVQF